MVRGARVKRRRDRDRAGYFGFSCVREGLTSPATPSPALAQTAWLAGQSFQTVAPDFISNGVQL